MASRTAYSTWTPQKPTRFDGHYIRNRSTLDIGVLGYIGIVQHKEHSPEVLSIPPGTPCITPLILNLDNIWTCVVSFIPRNKTLFERQAGWTTELVRIFYREENNILTLMGIEPRPVRRRVTIPRNLSRLSDQKIRFGFF